MDYLNFCMSSRFCISWNSLKYKYEYGINSSEFLLYQLLTDQVYLLGLNLKLNYKLCEALAIIHGFGFCDNGYASWNAINEYFSDNDVEKIKIDIIKEKIKNVKNLADDEFLGYVDELFSNAPKTKEVKLVLESYKIIKTLQPLKNNNINLYYELVEKAHEELIYKSIEDIISIDIDKYIPLDMPKFSYVLSNEEKTDYFNNITNIMNEYKNKYNYSKEELIYHTIYSLTNE